MPTKPTDDIIEIAKKKLDPRDVLTAVISETPELRGPLVAAGLVREIEEGED